ncbi:hypothetical protein ACI48D_14945 [Massilia sp. LXY-6]|uniref:hypothetical protein n=1 Tax=Massilia sp. LXY-6 TaxID=3379823 RepID=UPI003EE2C790
MPVSQLPSGKYRVQIRRKGYPKYDKVFATRHEAEDAEASIRGEQKAVEAPTDVTLAECWAKYRQSQSFLQKAPKTRTTEAGRIQPVLAELGAYSLINLQNAPALIYDYIDKRSSTISPRTKKKLSTTSVRLQGVDEMNDVGVACYWGMEGACYGDETFTRRFCPVGPSRRQAASTEA